MTGKISASAINTVKRKARRNLPLTPDFRLEVVQDMKRAAMDCRLDSTNADDPIGFIFETLISICPDVTARELREVISAAEEALLKDLAHPPGLWKAVDCTSIEIQTWAKLAVTRVQNLANARFKIESFMKKRKKKFKKLPPVSAGR